MAPRAKGILPSVRGPLSHSWDRKFLHGLQLKTVWPISLMQGKWFHINRPELELKFPRAFSLLKCLLSIGKVRSLPRSGRVLRVRLNFVEPQVWHHLSPYVWGTEPLCASPPSDPVDFGHEPFCHVQTQIRAFTWLGAQEEFVHACSLRASQWPELKIKHSSLDYTAPYPEILMHVLRRGALLTWLGCKVTLPLTFTAGEGMALCYACFINSEHTFPFI